MRLLEDRENSLFSEQPRAKTRLIENVVLIALCAVAVMGAYGIVQLLS
jgi:nitrate reductase NapE component